MRHHFLIALFALSCGGLSAQGTQTAASGARRPVNDAELSLWLTNMKVYHRYTAEEMSAATGLSAREVNDAIRRLMIDPDKTLKRMSGTPLTVLPYPGGRHPRIGFLDGAVNPQRETKVSIFTPWEEAGYVVVDVPEAIFCQFGILYLAHTHVPTMWSEKNITLPQLEWTKLTEGAYVISRILPNKVRFGSKVIPGTDGVRMELWLQNGTPDKLTGLRVQMCSMLKGASGFNQQTNDNKLFKSPWAAAKSLDGKRWIITAWERCGRAWGNPPVPCLHSDPVFRDCPPGDVVRVRGWLSFYEGTDIDGELKRLEGVGWLRPSPGG